MTFSPSPLGMEQSMTHFRLVLLAFGVCSLLEVARASEKPRQTQTATDVQVLYSADARLRGAALKNIVGRGTEAAPVLIAVICDRSKPGFDRAWPGVAEALGELKAVQAVPCILRLLLTQYPPIGIVQSDQTLARNDPA